ncbi:disease resistance-like protein CSA1 [Cucurbita pepo subsp. pepo]|uniref:disease resistance-like protein CSA1 n=1 Tax=Cucurbita pepo subsp. pepo TaxID=3664 RepID=UPI000C9D4DB1|nr:disease resistance-like protein CSA1 [Cucurbita pepo subsp. pepo]
MEPTKGIHGMGGIGKTTIARVCYERIHDKFEAHCFISNIREKFETSSLPYLQSELLSRMFSIENSDIGDVHEGIAMINQAVFRKKILLVLDDVNCSDQIMGLIPNKDSFRNGSRIIITTRNAVSYDRLDEWENEIFLDVACFFMGKRKEIVEEILHNCGFPCQNKG